MTLDETLLEALPEYLRAHGFLDARAPAGGVRWEPGPRLRNRVLAGAWDGRVDAKEPVDEFGRIAFHVAPWALDAAIREMLTFELPGPQGSLPQHAIGDALLALALATQRPVNAVLGELLLWRLARRPSGPECPR